MKNILSLAGICLSAAVVTKMTYPSPDALIPWTLWLIWVVIGTIMIMAMFMECILQVIVTHTDERYSEIANTYAENIYYNFSDIKLLIPRRFYLFDSILKIYLHELTKSEKLSKIIRVIDLGDKPEDKPRVEFWGKTRDVNWGTLCKYTIIKHGGITEYKSFRYPPPKSVGK